MSDQLVTVATLLTTRDLVHFVLDKVINQRHQSTEEQTGHNLPVFHSTAVVRAEGQATQRPRQSSNQIRNHENVVPVMVIRRCNVCPTTTGKSPENANTSDNLRKRRVRPRSEDIPEEHQSEPGAGSDSDEDLEERTFGISIANGCRYGREPFVGVTVMFVLDNLPEMQRHSHNQGAEERGIREKSMSPRNPFAIELTQEIISDCR